MAVKLGHRSVPSSAELLRAEAERFLASKGICGATVWRVEGEGKEISWVLFSTAAHKARHAIVAGGGPSSWELINEDSGWPVL
jgi:hypothetical protein